MSTTQLSSRHSKGPQVNVGPAHSQRLGRVYAPLRATTGLPRAPSLTARASSGNGGPAADDDDETHIESRALQEILAGWVHGGTVASIAPLSAADSKGPAELQQLFIRRQEQLSSEAGSSTEAGAHHRAVQTHMKVSYSLAGCAEPAQPPDLATAIHTLGFTRAAAVLGLVRDRVSARWYAACSFSPS